MPGTCFLLRTRCFAASGHPYGYFCQDPILCSPWLPKRHCFYLATSLPALVTPITVLGMYTYQMVQDVEHSDYIIAWGKNSFTDDGPQLMLQRIKAAQKRGAKLIVIDPAAPDWRNCRPVDSHYTWLRWCPRLAMPQTDCGKRQIRSRFCQDYTRGFDPFAEYLSSLSPEQLSNWCGISDKTDCRTDRPVLLHPENFSGFLYWSGISAQRHSKQRAIFILWAITGNWMLKAVFISTPKSTNFQLKDIPEDNPAIGVKDSNVLPLYGCRTIFLFS